MIDETKRIVESISRAQRMRLANARNGIAELPRYSRFALEQLCKAGFAEPIDSNSRGVRQVQLTSLGLAVRDHLKDKTE